MNDDNSISVKKMIVHILDTNLQLPVLSNDEHPHDNEVYEFVGKHILKALKDENLKEASFTDQNNKIKQIAENVNKSYDGLNQYTSEIAELLFNIMLKNVDIPSADFVCCLFDFNNILYLGLLKFNYRSSYIHFVNTSEEGNCNLIIKQKTTLPGENQKIEECALINLTDFSVKLLEKRYEVNGEKVLYFSSMFLNCTSDSSNKEKAKVFKKATEDFSKKYHDGDFTKSAELKNAVSESILQNEAINVADIADNVYKASPQMKQAYLEHIEESGLKEKKIEVSDKFAQKTFMRQKIKTDTGIEISLPVNCYTDKQQVEFINNIDGTISILIKNIGHIINS